MPIYEFSQFIDVLNRDENKINDDNKWMNRDLFSKVTCYDHDHDLTFHKQVFLTKKFALLDETG